MTDTEFDVNTPGALVGKFVNHCGDKHIVYGDLRFGLNTAVFCFALFNPQARAYTNAKVDTISPWIEPIVKQKVKRVKGYFKSEHGHSLIETRWYPTLKDAINAYSLREDQIIETEYREFQE
jgi:hypothetical protein